MKTAAQYLDEYKEDIGEPELTDHQYHWLKILINEAREQAIKEDRINVAEYATCNDEGSVGKEGEYFEWWRVDKDSIINAPEIELK